MHHEVKIIVRGWQVSQVYAGQSTFMSAVNPNRLHDFFTDAPNGKHVKGYRYM